MAGLFGTDGVRARVNTGPMTAEAVVRLALAAGRWFADHNNRSTNTRPIVVIGKDTRLSGYMLESAMVAGFSSIGLDCRLLGPIPTPAVAHLTRSLRAELGVMISASHNPHHDNGIKLFAGTGEKISREVEKKIEFSYRKSGSAALDMAYIACGRYDGYYQRNLHLWDVAAGLILVEEAGGVINKINLEEYRDLKIIASSPDINEKLMEKISKPLD